jgi:glycosyltransferase involved in cell wall biosynthesis
MNAPNMPASARDPEDRSSPTPGIRKGRHCVAISINTSWNIVNFRSGLIRRLQAEGYEVAALAPPDEHSEVLVEMGCRFVPLMMDNKGANPLRDLALLRRYLTALRQLRPVAYLGYTIKPNVYGSLAAQRLGIPTINNVSGLGTAFIRNTWLTPIVKQLYRTAFRRSERVFFQNEDDRRLFLSLGLAATSRTGVLPGSGIDLTQFKPMAIAPRPPGSRHFLLIARLLWDKGIAEYVAAARRVRAIYPDCRFQLLGFLDVENRTAVGRADVEGWVRDGTIEYLGATDDVRPYINAADCIVLPSYREGTARTLLEAAAMGKPLIATDVPGCNNVVAHGVNGYLAEVRNAGDLALQIETMAALASPEVAAMGRRSRVKVERDFDEGFVIERYLELLEPLRAQHARPASRA